MQEIRQVVGPCEKGLQSARSVQCSSLLTVLHPPTPPPPAGRPGYDRQSHWAPSAWGLGSQACRLCSGSLGRFFAHKPLPSFPTGSSNRVFLQVHFEVA